MSELNKDAEQVEDNFESEIWGKGHFPNKVSPNEKIVLITRQDIALITLRTVGIIFTFILIFVLRTFLISIVEIPFWISLFDVFMYLSNGILLLFFTIMFHNYYLSLHIVTTERVLDVDQLGLFNRQVNELAVENIQDVTYIQNGFLALIFGFGNVIIKTSSFMSKVSTKEEPTNGFVFENVPSPRKIVEEINKIYHGYKIKDREKTAKMGADAIKEAFGGGEQVEEVKTEE